MNIQDCFPLGWTGLISLQSKGLSRVFFSPTVQKHQFFGAQPSLWSNRGWDSWMLASTQWIWVWANSERYWRTGKPGMLPSMGLQRVRHDRGTKQQQKEELAEKALSLLCVHVQERPCEDTGRKQPSASWEESHHQNLNQSKFFLN